MIRRYQISALLVSVIAAAGCDGIFSTDNWDPPGSMLTGAVVFNGQPVGVRTNGVQLDLWQIEPEYELEDRIPVYVDQDGTYSVALFDGTYDIVLRAGNGPWVDDPTRHRVVVRGNTTFDVPVKPYYTIQNESYTYSPEPGPGGSITATFTVGRHDTSRAVEYVGVYIGTTTFVDRTNAISIPNNVRERSGSAIQQELESGSPITITVNLPDNIHLTPSPARRNEVFVRVGVKTVGVAEMAFSQVTKVGI